MGVFSNFPGLNPPVDSANSAPPHSVIPATSTDTSTTTSTTSSTIPWWVWLIVVFVVLGMIAGSSA